MRIIRRARNWEKGMDTELRFHLDQQIRDYMAHGLSRLEAERRAGQEFGALELAKDECRDQRSTEWLNHIFRDVRHACRSLYKSPGFAAAVIATLALGIGANTAIFSLIYSVLLKPLPYPAADRVFSVETILPQHNAQTLPMRIQDYLDWRRANTAFESFAALTPAQWNLAGDGEPERLGGALVSANFFSFLGATPQRGRGFSPEEETPGRQNVVVISDSLWRRRYGASPDTIGKTILLNAVPHLVVGIAPHGLLVPTNTLLHPTLAFGPSVDIWKPIAPTNDELQAENWNYGILVRLRRGESAERGRQQLQRMLNSSIHAAVPDFTGELTTRLVPIREIYSSQVRLRLLLIFAASGLFLLIACTNIANLFLARVAGRATELATRIALGAGRARILSHLLMEGLLLAVVGGAVGAWGAHSAVRLLVAYGPAELRNLSAPGLNFAALWFALAVSVGTGVICGALPALHVWRKDAAATLQEAARSALGGRGAARLREALVAVEMTLGAALLASAGLLLHSFINVMAADRGYNVERVLSVDLGLSDSRYAPGPRRIAFFRELTRQIQALPGVQAAGAIGGLPANSGAAVAFQTIFYVTDANPPAVAMQRPVAFIRSVTPGYFAASGATLRAGRFLTESEPTPVAIISESLAKRLWPNQLMTALIGRVFRHGDFNGPPVTVAGIVADTRPGALDREPSPEVYRPQTQRAGGTMSLVIKTAQEPAALGAAVRAEIRKLDPDLPIPAIRTMREILSQTVAERRFQMVLTLLLALAALCLGSIGIYGVVSYSVACRTRDIGLRIALGAPRRDVMRWVFAIGLRPVLIGLAVGLIAAVCIGRALRAMLYGIAATDPVSLTLVALILLMTAILACYLPARRAATLDPVIALRHE
ncbi:MAG TPA: ABC transporter permease [Bryobacteraceae bacterium]|nr:ABC transporter permease [Bryobacteraceae bacterium]